MSRHIHYTRLFGVAPAQKVGLFLAALLIFLSGSGSLGVFARSLQDIQNEINQKQAIKNNAAVNSRGLGEEAQGIQGEINALSQQIASIQLQIDANTAKQNELNAQMDAAQKKLIEQRDLLSANIRSIYIEGDISPLEMIASSRNISDFVDKQEYRDRIQSNIALIVDEIETLKTQIEAQQKEVAAILAQQQSLRGDLATKNNEASAKLASVNQTKAGFDAQVASAAGDIAKLQREVQAMQAALSRVNVRNLPSSGRVEQGTVIGTVGNTGNSFGNHLHLRAQINGRAVNPMAYLGSRWITPTSGRITQYFGENPWQYGYGAKGHDGVDYGAPAGTPIKAVESGELYKGWSQQLVGYWHFGCMAMIRHDDGLLSIYGHMQAGNC